MRSYNLKYDFSHYHGNFFQIVQNFYLCSIYTGGLRIEHIFLYTLSISTLIYVSRMHV